MLCSVRNSNKFRRGDNNGNQFRASECGAGAPFQTHRLGSQSQEEPGDDKRALADNGLSLLLGNVANCGFLKCGDDELLRLKFTSDRWPFLDARRYRPTELGGGIGVLCVCVQ
jgi:hypothetical protein